MFTAKSLDERLLPYVRNIMQVEDVTTGGGDGSFLARYRGKLILDSQLAYDNLEPAFKREGVTLLFRKEGEQDVILALSGVIQPKPSDPRVNLLLFAFTLLSVLFVGVFYSLEDATIIEKHGWIVGLILSLPAGIPYAASLLGILAAHEFGHYLAARYHQTPVSLPYFLPLPIPFSFGTLGAFIQLKSPPKNRRILLDIGLAGPIAGLVVAIPVLILGLSLSKVGPLPTSSEDLAGTILEGNSILYLLIKFLVTGEWLPTPVDFGGLSPWLYWLRYIVLGLPLPMGGRDVSLHPVAWAGWAGLLVTALNLIPAGQLDGGHVLFVLFGGKAQRVWPVIVVGLLAMGLVWPGWFLWAAMIFFLGRRYAQPLDDITPLDGRRKLLAFFGLVLFFLVLIPVPMRGFMG